MENIEQPKEIQSFCQTLVFFPLFLFFSSSNKTNIRIINVNFPLCVSILRRFLFILTLLLVRFLLHVLLLFPLRYSYCSMVTIIGWKAILNKEEKNSTVTRIERGSMKPFSNAKGRRRKCLALASLCSRFKNHQHVMNSLLPAHTMLLIWIISYNYIFIILSSHVFSFFAFPEVFLRLHFFCCSLVLAHTPRPQKHSDNDDTNVCNKRFESL